MIWPDSEMELENRAGLGILRKKVKKRLHK